MKHIHYSADGSSEFEIFGLETSESETLVRELLESKIFERESIEPEPFEFEIGGCLCCISGDQELTDLIPERWRHFRRPVQLPGRRIRIRLEEMEFRPVDGISDGWLSLRPSDQHSIIYVQGGRTVFSLCFISEDELTVRVRKALDSYVRIGIHYGILCLLYRECVGLHGVTLLCGDEIVVLSAPSGTGKTTLAHLLEKYCDAIVINGDFALLRPTEEGVIFEPTPFCGTSRRCLNHRVRVNRLVFLGQSSDNRWHAMEGAEALTQFMSNTFVPSWDHKMLIAVQENILRCISGMGVYAYTFAPEREAAEMFYRHLINDTQEPTGNNTYKEVKDGF